MSAAAWLAIAALAGAGAPAPSSYRLRWTRAAGAEACVDDGELAARVAQRLGRPVFGGGADATIIDAQVAPRAGGWHVSITVRGPAGESRGARELDQDGADCRALDDPLALILALILDLDAAEVAGAEAPVPAPPSARAGWRIEATVDAVAGAGVVPGAGLGAQVELAIDAPGAWPVIAGAGWWSAGEEDAGSGGVVRVERWQLQAGLCTPRAPMGALAVAACAGAAVERIAARGLGFDRDHAASSTIGAARLGGRAALALRGPTFAAAELGVEVPFARPRFVVDDGGLTPVYRVPPVALVAALGVGVRF